MLEYHGTKWLTFHCHVWLLEGSTRLSKNMKFIGNHADNCIFQTPVWDASHWKNSCWYGFPVSSEAEDNQRFSPGLFCTWNEHIQHPKGVHWTRPSRGGSWTRHSCNMFRIAVKDEAWPQDVLGCPLVNICMALWKSACENLSMILQKIEHGVLLAGKSCELLVPIMPLDQETPGYLVEFLWDEAATVAIAVKYCGASFSQPSRGVLIQCTYTHTHPPTQWAVATVLLNIDHSSALI